MTLYTHEIISEIFKVYPNLRTKFKDEVISSSATTKAGIRHTDSHEAKPLARKIAASSWEEDPNEAISELAIYIRDILVENGHKKYKARTIRNWIRDLDPGGGKLGRPANKT